MRVVALTTTTIATWASLFSCGNKQPELPPTPETYQISCVAEYRGFEPRMTDYWHNDDAYAQEDEAQWCFLNYRNNTELVYVREADYYGN